MKHLLVLGGLLALAGCATPMPKTTADGFLTEVPEAVIALAAPYQNLSAVQLNPADGCYWYSHEGPVENTMLPLRAEDGRVICAQAPEKLETAM
ncbi:hypothetical protein CEW89_00880 [Celeribacter ethanolicus]|uniref:Lipoprotein n=2 Tax=Celeribacter ethanolicus TaxID=1758178 RepID=A0A291G894_9RHOB|nr:hypothetical protein [Celeribacter ethanolicus]ATG46250.1 hypothetical protein CEW89_00880 [Celeribacter ethanolicus]